MTSGALFWLGLAAASGVGLLFSLLQLHKRRQELTTLQAEAVAHSTAATLANERSQTLEAELASVQQRLSEVNAQLSAQHATLSERDSHHQNQMKWVEESRTTLRAELEVIGQKLLASSGKALETTNQKASTAYSNPSPRKSISFKHGSIRYTRTWCATAPRSVNKSSTWSPWASPCQERHRI